MLALADFSGLGGESDIWNEWREPWQNGSASGLYRRLTMIKAGLIGVARYYADDYIVWKYEEGDVARISQAARPEKDLMTQRYVFLQKEGKTSLNKSSFALGFRGFLEIYLYTLGEEAPEGISDIAHLCNAAYGRLSGV